MSECLGAAAIELSDCGAVGGARDVTAPRSLYLLMGFHVFVEAIVRSIGGSVI